MKPPLFLSLRSTLTTAMLSGVVISGWTPLRAQQPFAATAEAVPSPTAPSFEYQLGRIAQDQPNGRKVYELRATQARNSRLVGQIVRLTIEETTGQDRFTKVISLRTGKHKTVAQFCGEWRGILAKFTRETSNGQLLGKVGDLKYGGEVRFVAESPDALRYETLTQGEPDLVAKLTPDDVANAVALLGGTSVPTAAAVRKTAE